jgi:ribosomal protein S18 acetylase RimI-like enzyme
MCGPLPASSDIRLLSGADTAQLASINDAYRFIDWTAEQLHESMQKSENFTGLKIVVANYIACYIVGWLWSDEYEIALIATAPGYARKGYGTKLIHSLRGYFPQITQIVLEVNARNEAAIEFYRKLGFKVTTTRPRYYSDGADALLMHLALN